MLPTVRFSSASRTAGYAVVPAMFVALFVATPVALDAQTEPAAKYPYVAVVNKQAAEMMSGGGKNYARIAKADKGDLVVVRGAGGAKGEWLRVQSPKPFLAYITTKLVKKVDDRTGQVTAQRVSLRPRPSLQRFPVGQVRIGTKLAITDEKNGFYEVIAPPETEVWIRGSEVRALGPVSKYAKRLEELRNAALAKYDPSAARQGDPKKAAAKTAAAKAAGIDPNKPDPKAGANKTAANKTGSNKTGAPATVPGNPAANGTPLSMNGARGAGQPTPLMQRLGAIQARYDNPKTRKDLAAMQAVLDDLIALEKETEKSDDLHARIRVTQLSAKVRVAMIERRTAIERRKHQQAVRPDSGVVTYNGWLRKESKLLRNGTLYKLEKGGVVQCYLTTKKYDLARFLDKHVSVSGELQPRKRMLENVYLEVERLKVLSK